MKYLSVLFLSFFYSAMAHSGVISISAFIDGTSELIIDNDTAYWHHTAFAAPGRWSENDYPTTINGVDWLPTWPLLGRNDFCNCNSSTVTGIFPALSSLTDFSLNVISGRGVVSLIETPSILNGYKMEIEFDDFFFGGAAWYEVEISYSEVPEPSLVFLMAFGLLGIFLRKKLNG